MAKEKFEITITADGNDADYQTQNSIIDQEELDLIMPLIQKIKAFKPYTTPCSWSVKGTEHRHNYPHNECLREDMGEKSPKELYDVSEEVIEAFNDLLPYNDYGLHTINSIYITPYVKKKQLL